jgi:hypothetical protein
MINTKKFLKKFFEFQKDIAFDDLKQLSFGILISSKINDSFFWNTCFPKKEISIFDIKKIEKLMLLIKKTPCFYLLNDDSKNKKLLEKENYKKESTDQWMFFSNEVNSGDFGDYKKVKNSDDLNIFLETFNQCYQKDDPQNPYGEVGGYIETARKAWIKKSKKNELEYFIFYDGNQKPVAVSSLTNFKGIGYISNVGSLREVRGLGFGKKATLFCINKSILNKNKAHCLATEKGHYPYEFYKRIGFKDKFSASYYLKKI